MKMCNRDMGDFFEYLGFKEVMEKAQTNSEANKSDKIFERIDNLYGSGNNSNNDEDEQIENKPFG